MTKIASNRRQLLQIATGGFSITGIGLVRGNNTVVIPITRDHKGVVRTMRVPRKAYRYDQHVKQLAKRLSERRIRDENIASVKVTSANKTVNGHPVTKLQVGIPEDGKPSEVPDSIEGVPIEKVRDAEFVPGECHNTGTYDPVPGGVKITAQDTVATGFGRVMDVSNGESRYMTCAHVVEEKDDLDCGTGEGSKVAQGGNIMGKVAKGSIDGDWAIIKETSGDDITGYDKDVLWENHGYRDFEDFYTEDGLRELMKNDDALYKMGLTSGSTNGLINAMNVDEEGYCGHRTVDSSGDPYGVELTVPGGPGDSGAPVFTKYPNNPDEQLSSAGHWVGYDENSDSNSTGCDPAWWTTEKKAYSITYMIPSYYLSSEYAIEPWLI